MNEEQSSTHDEIEEYLTVLLSRPDKKQRLRRVIQALDETVQQWERIARHSQFKAWLQETNSSTQLPRFRMLRDAWHERDAETLAMVFQLFLDHASGKRPYPCGTPLRSTDKRVGQIIARNYEVIDLLGVGGFGEVFLVYSHEESVHAFYALKILRSALGADPEVVSRFEREARVLLNLESHPYLVPMRFLEKSGDEIAVVMDYLPPDSMGRVTLGDHIRHGPISPQNQAQWMLECCSGLGYAYEAGISAHRDIKPSNVLVDLRRRARISDFGLASMGIASGSATLSRNAAAPFSTDGTETVKGSSFGTPAYMSPEQFRDAHSCDMRSDIYSLGIMFYEMASQGIS